jgi:hypothetical protein
MASYEDRKIIFENIKLLSNTEQEEIYRIIKRYKQEYTENSNGIFFDLMTIDNECFFKMKEYIEFCLKNRQEHEERLKELDTLRNETYVEV